MTYAICATLFIFFISYTIIISEKVHRTVMALFGAMLMVLAGVISQEQAIHHIDFNTLALLIGMMIQVHVLGQTGLFKFLSVWAAQKAKGNPILLMMGLSILVAVCSALLDNVTTVLLTVPMTFALVRDLRISPLPFIMAQILSSNIGGTCTMIGDPPNIMIGSAVAEIDFMSFIYNLALPCLVVFVVNMGLLLLIYRKELSGPKSERQRIMKIKLRGLIRAPRLLRRCAISLGVTIVFFCCHGQIPGWQMESGTAALAGAALLLMISMPDKESRIESVFSHVEWMTIFFFIGLFVLVGGLQVNGIIKYMADGAMALTQGDPTVTTFTVLGLSAVMSSFVDNIPFVATMITMIKDMGTMGYAPLEPLWWALSLGACLGGNGTIIGASANVVAISLARKHGPNHSFFGFMQVAFPLMIVPIGISALYLWLKFLQK